MRDDMTIQDVKLEKTLYRSYSIFFRDESSDELAKKIIDGDYTILKKYKDTARNFVALVEIEVDGKNIKDDVQKLKFILKSPKNEFRIPQRKIQTLIKDGEAVSTIKNILSVDTYVKEKFGEELFVLPICAMVERRNGMISDSHILFEYIDGRTTSCMSVVEKDRLIELIEKIHKLNRYHGDFNPSNFIMSSDGNIKIIDTQMKKMGFGNYRAHYDILTMQMDNYNEMVYPYKKNFYYYAALCMKRYKKNKIISSIKKFKKDLRARGWRI